MAILLDANLTPTPSYATGLAPTLTVVTGAAAASGSKIFLAISDFDNTGNQMTGPVGGGLTWVLAQGGFGAADEQWLFVADAPAGLASGTSIVISWAASVNARAASCCSFTGLATGTTPDFLSFSTAGSTGWTAGTITTTNPDSLIFGFGMVDGSTPTFTPVAGFTEIHDWIGAADNEAWHTVYKVATSAGSQSAGGSGGSGAYSGCQISFSMGAGPQSGVVTPDYSKFPKAILAR